MKVSDILRVKGNTLFTVSPDQPLLEAVVSMAAHDIGWIVCGLHRQPQRQLDPVTTAHWAAPPLLLPDLAAALRRAEPTAPA